jgi:hypothetical protein
MAQIFLDNNEYINKTIKRGDLIKSIFNEIKIYDGKHIHNLEYNQSVGYYMERYIPSKFTIEEFPPSHWHYALQDLTIKYNKDIIWFTPNLYNYSNPQIITPTTVRILNKQNKYPIYLVYTKPFKTNTYPYIIEILQKITIPVSCENGYTLNQPDSIVIIDNNIVTSKYEVIKPKSIEKLIKHAIDYNWRDIIVKYFYKVRIKRRHITPKIFDFCITNNTQKITHINIKLFDKNLF